VELSVDMLALAIASKEAHGSILDSLKTLNQAVDNTGQQCIIVVANALTTVFLLSFSVNQLVLSVG